MGIGLFTLWPQIYPVKLFIFVLTPLPLLLYHLACVPMDRIRLRGVWHLLFTWVLVTSDIFWLRQSTFDILLQPRVLFPP